MADKKIDKSGKLTFCHVDGYCKNHDTFQPHYVRPNLDKIFTKNEYEIFQDLNESSYKASAEDFYSLVSSEEAAALLHYSDSGFKAINRGLMGATTNSESLVGLLDASIDKAIPKNKTVFRGIKRDINKNVGESHIFETFVSTSYNPHKAFEFTDSSSPILLILETKLGAPISIIHREMEVLLPRNKEFLVTDIIFSNLRLFYPGTKDYSVSKKETKIYKLAEI